MDDRGEVVISGVGWLAAPPRDAGPADGAPVDAWREVRLFEPYPIDEEAPRKAEQRAMGQSILAATFAAGRALSDAALKGDAERLADTQILTAGRCVDRDEALDWRVLEAVSAGEADAAGVNRMLREGLRPSLFLAQLPNLISASIAIAHDVTGRSQTFIGEEAAGVEALATALDRLGLGEAQRCLAGGVFWPGDAAFVEAVGAGPASARPGYPLAASAVYLVLETARAAAARGHRPRCRMRGYVRAAHDSGLSLEDLLSTAGVAVGERGACVVVGGRGQPGQAARAAELLRAVSPFASEAPIVQVGERYGACFEALAPTAVALAMQRLAAEPGGKPYERALAIVLAADCDAIFHLERIAP